MVCHLIYIFVEFNNIFLDEIETSVRKRETCDNIAKKTGKENHKFHLLMSFFYTLYKVDDVIANVMIH